LHKLIAQAAQHGNFELSYFDVGDLPGPAVAVPLARELAARYRGNTGGGLGQILLPGATGLEMLRALALRLQARGIYCPHAAVASPAAVGIPKAASQNRP